MMTEICERIANGESLRGICAGEGMPSAPLVMKWLANDEDGALREQYARAREAQADHIFDEILEIADDGKNDWMEKNGEESVGYALNGEHVQRSKLRIDARKWMAGKMRPKVYGDKIQTEHTGEVKIDTSPGDAIKAMLDAKRKRSTG
jgi:hypothetical protein